MNYPYPYSHPPQGRAIAYVRQCQTPADLPDGIAGGPGKFYSIHDADGNRLALTPSRDLAFAVVRRNDMVPVSVH